MSNTVFFLNGISKETMMVFSLEKNEVFLAFSDISMITGRKSSQYMEP